MQRRVKPAAVAYVVDDGERSVGESGEMFSATFPIACLGAVVRIACMPKIVEQQLNRRVYFRAKLNDGYVAF